MAPLIAISVPSIYPQTHPGGPLPPRLAHCTPDMKRSIAQVATALKARGGRLLLSDLFRSYDMQLGSHMDFVSGKKKAFSPAPGGSLHEAGRALDLDLSALKMPLAEFWTIAHAAGLSPIIDEPKSNKSEAWHFSCRGSHQLVYDYYKAGKGTNFKGPYPAMAASAIVSVGIKVDVFGAGQEAARIQSGLIRLGHEIGNLDGQTGPRTRDALSSAGLARSTPADTFTAVEHALQARFPHEYFDAEASAAPFA